jgi:hypothetical protein
MSVRCVYLCVTPLMLSLGQYFGLIECRNVRMFMCVCVCVCVCVWVGVWVGGCMTIILAISRLSYF